MEKQPGEIIYQETPYVHVLTTTKRGVLCDYCFESVEKLKTCSSCQTLKYCHRKCQLLDWDVHKLECNVLKDLPAEVVMTDTIRLFLRLLIRHKKGDDEKLFSKDPLWSRPFKDLMTHSPEMKIDARRCKEFISLNYLTRIVSQQFQFPSHEAFWDIFGRMVINSCSILDKENKDTLGAGIYLGMSRIDHSCDPNAVYTFSGMKITVRATKHVLKAEPQKLSISYIDICRPSWERKKELKESYYFDCQCSLCTTKCEKYDRLMTSFKCPNSDCNGFIGLKRDGKGNSVWPCEKCKNAPSSDERIEQLHKIWDDTCCYKKTLCDLFKQGDLEFTLQSAEKKERFLLENNFYECNVNLIDTMDIISDTLLQLRLFDKAVNYTEKLSKGLFRISPIMSGLSFLKHGKLQLYLNRVQEATKTLERTEKILRVMFGSDDMVCKMLRDLQQQCSLVSLAENFSGFHWE